MKFVSKRTWIGTVFLIVIEQYIKIVINNSFLDKRFPILPPLLYFEPTFNRQYSWVNSMLKFGNSKWIHIILVAIMIIFIYLFYKYLNKELGNNKTINVMFAFLFSGATCSLIDKIFWNGSLDYILIKDLFIFDLKDGYISIFIGLLILALVFNNKTIKQIDDRNIIKEFTKYILRKS